MLRSLFPIIPIPAANRDAHIVVIPGVGTTRPQRWSTNSKKWLENIFGNTQLQVQIVWYDYALDGSSKSTALQQIIAQGTKLVEKIHDEYVNGQANPRPVFFVCHSLGGVVLKKAIGCIQERFHDFKDVRKVLAGILFLGTPHVSDQKLLPRYNLIEKILRSVLNLKIEKNAIDPSGDNILLAKVCKEFGDTIYQVPIISTWESQPSTVLEKRFYARIFSRTTSLRLITQETCAVRSPRETVIEVDNDHGGICNIDINSPLFDQVRTEITRIIGVHTELLLDNKRSDPIPGLGSLSLRSYTEHGIEHTRNATSLPPESDQLRQEPSSLEDSGGAVAGSTSQASNTEEPDPPLTFDPVRRSPKLPCFSVSSHEKNPDFFGRKSVLTRMDDVLLPDIMHDSGAVPLKSFALCGIGGTGKTQIAIEYAHTRKTKFDAVFWVSADNETVLKQEFAGIAAQLGLADPDLDIPAACDVVKEWLSNPVRQHDKENTGDSEDTAMGDASWLLIYDNADNLTVLEEFWPTAGLGSVIITSRDSLARTSKLYTRTANSGLDLPPFTDAEAEEFIKIQTPEHLRQGHDFYVADVASKLGNLPLLITQMSSLMERLRLSYKDFLLLCDENGITEVNWSGGDIARADQAFSIFQKLGLKDLPPSSLGILQMVSFLDPDRVPEEILEGGIGLRSSPNYPSSRMEYMAARLELNKASLIDVRPATNGKEVSLSLHRIVQDVARSGMTSVDYVKMFEATIQAVSSVWKFGTLLDRWNVSRFESCSKIFPSVAKLMSWQKVTLELGDCQDPDACAELYNDAGWYWFERGFPEEAKEYFRMTEAVYDRYQKHNVGSTTKMTYLLRRANLNHATASMETNDKRDCLTRYKKWLEESSGAEPGLDEASYGYELACIHNEMGVAYAMNEQIDSAITSFQESINQFYRLTDYKDIMLNWPQPNLGFMYWIQGKYEEAEAILLEILNVQELEYGIDDVVSFKTGKILYCLGNVYTSQAVRELDEVERRKLLEKALKYHVRCLAQYRVTLGDKHHRVGDVLHRLADHYISRCIPPRYKEAQTSLKEALSIFSSRPYYKNQLARTTFKMGHLLKATGKASEAQIELSKAFDLRKSLGVRDGKGIEDVEESDYDRLVIFWSR